MLRKLSGRLTYANVMATLGVFIALGGSAYAVNTVNSSDITDGQVKSVDIGNGEINSADVKDQSLTTFDVSTFLGADIVDGTLTSADVAPGTFVAGRGQLLSNRIVLTPGQAQTLITIPGLGEVRGSCDPTEAVVSWVNTTGGPVDVWEDHDTPGKSLGYVADPNDHQEVAISSTSTPNAFTMSSTLSLGTGNQPGARNVATVRGSAFQSANNAPCGLQAQGTLWTSP